MAGGNSWNSAPSVALILDGRDQGEGAKRRDGTGRGAGDHRAMERRQQRRSVRTQHRSEQGGRYQPAVRATALLKPEADAV